MPKATKLHNKGKSSSIQKPCKVDTVNESVDPDDSMRQFQLELCWCIQQLERSLHEKKGNEKQLQELWKVLTILKNNNQPTIRKRQLMRTHFGDYRAKMAAEEKKLAKMASKINISDVPDKPKAKFLRKSAFLTTGDSSFRFDFNLTPDQISDENKAPNPHSSVVPVVSGGGGGNTKTNADAPAAVNKAVNTDDIDSNNFKFSFSGSEFKFNFNVNNS